MSILRDITKMAEKFLDNPDILLFVGARQAGKTTILRQIEEILRQRKLPTSFLNLEDPDYLSLLNESPKNLFSIITLDLQKRSFVFIDEVQYLKDPSRFLKYFRDTYGEQIKLIVSGSSVFYLDEKFHDSLAGRKKIFPVRTLSFREFLRFKGETGLAGKDLKTLSLINKETIRRFYHEFMLFGGYPRVVLAPLAEKQDLLQELAYSYIKKDVLEARVSQEEVFYQLFKILASGIGNLVNASELANTLDVSKTLIERYLFIMQKSFHVRLIRPFFKNVRKELRKMPKAYFYDLGLRNFFVHNFQPFADREDRGQLLENAVFRQIVDLAPEDEMQFWRTAARHEVDFVIQGNHAVEVKTNAKQSHGKSIRAFREAYPDIPLEIISEPWVL